MATIAPGRWGSPVGCGVFDLSCTVDAPYFVNTRSGQTSNIGSRRAYRGLAYALLALVWVADEAFRLQKVAYAPPPAMGRACFLMSSSCVPGVYCPVAIPKYLLAKLRTCSAASCSFCGTSRAAARSTLSSRAMVEARSVRLFWKSESGALETTPAATDSASCVAVSRKGSLAACAAAAAACGTRRHHGRCVHPWSSERKCSFESTGGRVPLGERPG